MTGKILVEQGLVDGIRVEVTRKRGFEGRKIITDHDLMGEAHPQMKHQSDATSMLPGAIGETSDFEVVREEFDVQSKVNDSFVKFNEADFQTQSFDYQGPKSHPSKHH
ncbi:hypothetical protein Ancab_006486 [Ancistrocladus abbreviatus]